MRSDRAKVVVRLASWILILVGVALLMMAAWVAYGDTRAGLHPKESIDGAVFGAFAIIVGLILRMLPP